MDEHAGRLLERPDSPARLPAVHAPSWPSTSEWTGGGAARGSPPDRSSTSPTRTHSLTAGLVSRGSDLGSLEGLDQVALTPSGATIPLPAGDGPRYLPLEEHGFYTVRQPGVGSGPRPFMMAVNVDLEESNLARIDTEELGCPDDGPPGRLARVALNVDEACITPEGGPGGGGSLCGVGSLMVALALFIAETAVVELGVDGRGAGAQVSRFGLRKVVRGSTWGMACPDRRQYVESVRSKGRRKDMSESEEF